MSLEFARKQGFKLKKIKRLIYIRNVNSSFNKKRPIEHIVEVNIYDQGHRERMEINVISSQKWSVILEILQLAYHNPEIDWRTKEVKMTRYLEEYGKQQRLKKRKLEWQKQKEEKKKRRRERNKSRKSRKNKKKTKNERSLKKKPRNQSLKGFISRSISLEEK